MVLCIIPPNFKPIAERVRAVTSLGKKWKIDQSHLPWARRRWSEMTVMMIFLSHSFPNMCSVNIQQWRDITFAVYSEYILLFLTFWIKMINVVNFYITWNVSLVTSKWTEIKKTQLLEKNTGVGGAVRFLVVGTIGQGERPPRGQLWMEQCLTLLKYWPI